jgi:hypothetical protein
MTFPTLPWHVGAPLMLFFGILSVWAYWNEITVAWATRHSKKMSLSAIGRHVGFYSSWSISVKNKNPQETWNSVLSREIAGKIIEGKLRASGMLCHGAHTEGFGTPINLAPTQIPVEFFEKNVIDFFVAVLPEFGVDVGFIDGMMGDKSVMFDQVTFDKKSVLELWPRRSNRRAWKHKSPFLLEAIRFKRSVDASVSALAERVR